MANEAEDTPKHVRSGAFSVDRRKALERLRHFQLREPTTFIDLWIRAAAASGASRITVTANQQTLGVSFDGRSFSRDDLEDPWSPIFQDRSPRREAARQLGLGCLGALRLMPRHVMVTSGTFRLVLESVDRYRVEETTEATTTTVGIEWGSAAKWASPQTVNRFLNIESFAMLPCSLAVSGEERSPRTAPPDSFAFRRGRVRGWVAPRGADWHADSLIQLYHHGVLVEPLFIELPVRISAWINDDAAALDASQARVAQGERHRAVEGIVASRALDLVGRLANRQRSAFAAVAQRLADPALLQRWRARSAWEPSGLDLPTSFDRASSTLRLQAEAAPGLIWDAWLTDWLQNAAQSLLTEPGRDASDPLRWALWGTPLFLAASGGTLNSIDLFQQRERLGTILYSTKPQPGSEGLVWCPTPHDLTWLKRRFGEGVREQ